MSSVPESSPGSATEPPLDGSFLYAIIEHVAHPIFVKDRAFRFVVVNHALTDLVSIDKEKLLGKTDYDFFPKHEADLFREADEEMFRRGEVVEIIEERITDGHGELHVLSTTKVPLRNARGEITHLVGIIHDITALARAKEDLRERNARLEEFLSERASALHDAQQELMRRQRLSVIGQLAGGVAHQVRNPLATIRNAAYLLKLTLGSGISEDAQRSLDIINDEVARANGIITDLVEYARVREAHRKPCSLAYLKSQALGGIEVPEGVVLACDVPETCVVNVDGEQVQRALFNLLRNAVEAAAPEGEVRVSVETVGDEVHVILRDTGAGLPDEVRAQLDSPTDTTRPSTVGLGLMTARALIENQGGALRYRAIPEGGSRFEVVLPKG